jgi:KipI family sensor histidine kinase inhibitor
VSRIREAGDSALLFELDEVIDPRVNARAIAIAAAIRSKHMAGVRDVVSTYRSIAVFFDPLQLNPDVIRERLARVSDAPLEVVHGKTVEVPVHYGGEAGPDLPAVAEWAGLSAEAVAQRHAHTEYRVFMLGFLPGFAYLGSVDERIAAPRLPSPRLRVPSGSVGIAGRQTGIYPRESSGGWQIIGHSPLRIFDPDSVPASLLGPGDKVRFVPISSGRVATAALGRAPATPTTSDSRLERDSRTVSILRPGLFTTIQDRGRWGYQASGVPVAGALDLLSHRIANLLVGNAPDAATLEVTLAGPELRIDQETCVAVTGADLQASVDGTAITPGGVANCRQGSVLRFGERVSGARAYVAFDGGVDVAMTLDSRSTHVGAALGGLEGRALRAGDRLPLGSPTHRVAKAIETRSNAGVGGARLRVLPGPQDDFFSDSAFGALEQGRFHVSPQSNRMGYRLSGGSIRRVENREMISDVAFVGGIQIPPSGEPILLMSDRQTTGGYPQIATVITADLPTAGQLAPGDWVEFTRCTREEAIAALRDQEAMLVGFA